MVETTSSCCSPSSEHSHGHSPKAPIWRRIDKAWVASAMILLVVAIFDKEQLWPTVTFTAGALGHTAIFISFAVFAIGYLKASGAESIIARAFTGPQSRMIILAAMMGGLSPFCSCEVIPFIAALLALGTPLSAVMAFWLASPLMDPAMFSVTWSALGFDFALAKTIAAIAIGLFGGFTVMFMAKTPVFANPLKERTTANSCSSNTFAGTPLWAFWQESARLKTFRAAVIENGGFLLKWLTTAYLFEAIMIHYIPASLIAGHLGGDGIWPIFLGGIIGAPAYLNGYAAVPLVQGLLAQGMAPGAAMSFMIAGGVSCVPAAIAVWALVKPRVFIAYLLLATSGAMIAGLVWNTLN